MNEYKKLHKYFNNLFYIKGIKKISDTTFDSIPYTSDKKYDGIKGVKNKIYHLLEIKDIKKIHIDKINSNISNAKEFIIQPKLDGIFINLIYDNGILLYALTKGNNIIGDNILHKIQHIIPNNIPFLNKIEIYGELIFPNKYTINNKHSRYFIISIINKIHIDEEISNSITFFVHGVGYNIQTLYKQYNINNQYDLILLLKTFKFNTVNSILINSLDEVKYIYDNISKIQNLDFDIDGIIIKHLYNNTIFGVKFNTNTSISKVIDIKYCIGSNGKLVPILKIQPIIINETNINKINMHSTKFLELKCTGIDSIIEVSKHGGIVPCVNNVITPSNKYNIPSECIFCNTKLHKSNIGIMCINNSCKSQLSYKIKNKYKTLMIKNISLKTIIKLIDQLNISCTYDLIYIFIYHTKNISNIIGEKITQKILLNIYTMFEKINTYTISIILNIDNISIKTANKIFNIQSDEYNQYIKNINNIKVNKNIKEFLIKNNIFYMLKDTCNKIINMINYVKK